MFMNIEISTENGETTQVPMNANAATVIRYKTIFNEDLTKNIVNVMHSLTTKSMDNDDEKIEAIGELDTDTISKLGYVMNMQALNKTKEANREDYIDWLGKFSPIAFIECAGDIISLYFGQKIGTSNPKKEDAPQIES